MSEAEAPDAQLGLPPDTDSLDRAPLGCPPDRP